jgi:hypothetical protein
MLTASDVVSAILAVVDVITIPIYVLVLVCIVKNAKTTLKSSFFQLTISMGVADLLSDDGGMSTTRHTGAGSVRWFAVGDSWKSAMLLCK